MRITNNTQTLERGGVGEETTFRIQANARAFSILSSNLYTDKIKAVIRELSCNAWDSHVAAGKQGTPFDVHLPNNLEPWFSVTDYGLGLSHEQVMDLYTTYFSSTKSDSNDYVGALGLGSKSPFAYTTGFDVVSTHNGVQNSYAMFINERGEPSVAQLGSQPTTAPNGVMVKLPVKRDDIHNFCATAQEVFLWFTHQPVVTGNSSYQVITITRTQEGDGWYLRDADRYYRGGCVARMGSVAYPIKSSQLNNRFTSLIHLPLVIEFNIGELDVAASREELSYDPTTIAVLESKLDQVLQNIRDVVNKQFEEAPTLWAARCLYHQLWHRNYHTRGLIQVLNSAGVYPKWQGEDISANDFYAKTLTENLAVVLHHVRDSGRREQARYITTSNEVTFFRQDCVDTTSRVGLWLKAEQKAGRHPRAHIITGEDDVVAQVLAQLGNPPIQSAKSLTRAERVVMKFKGAVWVGRASIWGRVRKSDNWGNEKELTTSQGGLYVQIDVLDPVSPDGQDVVMGDLVRGMVGLGIIKSATEIWGINKTNVKKIVGEPKWIEFTSWAHQEVQKFIDNGKWKDRVVATGLINSFVQAAGNNQSNWQVFAKHENVIGRMVREWNQHTDVLSKAKSKNMDITIQDLTLAARSIGVDIKGIRPDTAHVDLLFDEIKARYPLMRFAFGLRNEPLTPFVEYVESIDKNSPQNNT